MTEMIVLTLLTSLISFLKIYILLLSMRVTLTWFPSINWYTQPFYTLIKLTNPYLRLFKGLLPALFGLDISPILAFLFIEALIDIATYYTTVM
jgi:YggT family protein